MQALRVEDKGKGKDGLDRWQLRQKLVQLCCECSLKQGDR